MYILSSLIQSIIILGFLALVIFIFYKVLFKKGGITEEIMDKISFPKLFLWSIGIGILGYNFFFHDHLFAKDFMPGIGIGLFSISIFAGLLLSFPKSKRNPLVYSLAIVGSLAGLAFAFRANEFVHNINGLVAFLSAIALTALYVLDHVKWNAPFLVRSTWQWLYQSLIHSVGLFKYMFQFKSNKNAKAVKAIKTTVITLVVLLFFVTLLSNADPIFDTLVSDMQEEAVERTILSIVLAVVVTFLLSLHVKTQEVKSHSFKLFGFYDLAIPSLGLVILFAAFLFVQGKYLFGSHIDFQSFDLTYSEYVRKGFIELLVVTFFGSLISYLLIIKHREEDKGRAQFLTGINVILMLELFAMLGSALKRDIMYIDIYSLTRIRMVGGAFLAWLAVILLLLFILNLSKKIKEKHLFQGVLSASLIAMLYFNLANMDQIVANAEPPEDIAKDHFYMVNLSEDAIDGWAEAILETQRYFNSLLGERLGFTEEDKSRLGELKVTMNILVAKRDELREHDEEYSSYIFWNASRKNALKTMEEETALFDETLNCLVREIKDYQITWGLDLYEEELKRFRNYKQPLVQIAYSGPYTYHLNQILIEAVDDYPALKQELEQKYRNRYSIDHLKKDAELMQKLQARHVPEKCD